MFDPTQTAPVIDAAIDEPLLANLSGITYRQRIALVSLGIGGQAIHRPGIGPDWIIPELGVGWVIARSTMEALEREGLVEMRDQKAKLTRRGKWYARTAAYREADERMRKEEKRW